MNPLVAKVRSSVAMHVVGINRQRFNEAVSAESFSWVPATQARQVRRFGHEDLVFLFIYARLISIGFTVRRAGEITGLIKAKMDEPWPALNGFTVEEAKAIAHKYPPETAFVVVFGEALTGDTVQPAIVVRGSEFTASETRMWRGVGRATVSMLFDVAHIRDVVSEEVSKHFDEAESTNEVEAAE